MSCALCRQRKAKRVCPAVRADICPVCCGTKRIVEIACPATCIYLEHAHRHPASVVKRQQEADLLVLTKTLGRVSEGQLQLFFLLQTSILRFNNADRPQGLPGIADADVAEATGALAATLETAGRGVLYEHQSTSVVAESLRREIKTLLDQVGRGGGSRFEREAAEVLRGIERGARHDALGPGAGAQDYLSLVARVLQERPPAAKEATSIILP
jgi:hypothetical protein